MSWVNFEQKVNLRQPQTAAKLRKSGKQTFELSINMIKFELKVNIEFTGRPNATFVLLKQKVGALLSDS